MYGATSGATSQALACSSCPAGTWGSQYLGVARVYNACPLVSPCVIAIGCGGSLGRSPTSSAYTSNEDMKWIIAPQGATSVTITITAMDANNYYFFIKVCRLLCPCICIH
jgi:hypothetical protein